MLLLIPKTYVLFFRVYSKVGVRFGVGGWLTRMDESAVKVRRWRVLYYYLLKNPQKLRTIIPKLPT